MAKYDPLFEYLCGVGDEPVEMTFDEIEGLVGALPVSASAHAAWWANESAGSRHVQARSWLDAGREVESVDRDARRVRFTAATWRRG